MASQPTSDSELPLTPTLSQASSGSDTISVKCGSATGTLYVDKIRAPGNKGNLKCILSGSDWYSPIDFEIFRGKTKSRNWRRSILHENVQLGVFLSSIGVHLDKSSSPTPGSSLPSVPLDAKQSCNSPLTNPVLAFIKAYRLQGDVSGLRNTC